MVTSTVDLNYRDCELVEENKALKAVFVFSLGLRNQKKTSGGSVTKPAYTGMTMTSDCVHIGQVANIDVYV